MSEQLPIKEQFINFASWIMNFVLAIDRWEHDNGRSYKGEHEDIELNLLAGMYLAKMTPQEAAATYTETDMRIFMPYQTNTLIMAAALRQTTEKDMDVLGVFLKGADDKLDIITSPKVNPIQLLTELAKFLKESRKIIEAEMGKRKPNPDNPDWDEPDNAA